MIVITIISVVINFEIFCVQYERRYCLFLGTSFRLFFKLVCTRSRRKWLKKINTFESFRQSIVFCRLWSIIEIRSLWARLDTYYLIYGITMVVFDNDISIVVCRSGSSHAFSNNVHRHLFQMRPTKSGNSFRPDLCLTNISPADTDLRNISCHVILVSCTTNLQVIEPHSLWSH